MSIATPLTDDERLILAARALVNGTSRTQAVSSTDLPDAKVDEWAGGRPCNPVTSDGVYMALELQHRRTNQTDAVRLLGKLADRLEIATGPLFARQAGRDEMLAEIRAAPFKFLGLPWFEYEPRWSSVSFSQAPTAPTADAPSPVPVALSDDERLILAARALATSEKSNPGFNRTDYRDALTMLGTLAKRLEDTIADADRFRRIGETLDYAIAQQHGNDQKMYDVGKLHGREGMLAEIKAEPFKFLHGLGYELGKSSVKINATTPELEHCVALSLLLEEFAKRHAELHARWTAAVGTDGYIRSAFIDEDNALAERYRRIAAVLGHRGPLIRPSLHQRWESQQDERWPAFAASRHRHAVEPPPTSVPVSDRPFAIYFTSQWTDHEDAPAPVKVDHRVAVHAASQAMDPNAEEPGLSFEFLGKGALGEPKWFPRTPQQISPRLLKRLFDLLAGAVTPVITTPDGALTIHVGVIDADAQTK